MKKRFAVIPLIISMIAMMTVPVAASSNGAIIHSELDFFSPFVRILEKFSQNEQHGWLGIKIEDGSIEGIVDIEHGAKITEFEPDSPLLDCGFTDGDLIIAINGKSTKSAEELKEALKETEVGEKIVVTTVTLNAAYKYKYSDFTVKTYSMPASYLNLK